MNRRTVMAVVEADFPVIFDEDNPHNRYLGHELKRETRMLNWLRLIYDGNLVRHQNDHRYWTRIKQCDGSTRTFIGWTLEQELNYISKLQNHLKRKLQTNRTNIITDPLGVLFWRKIGLMRRHSEIVDDSVYKVNDDLDPYSNSEDEA